MSDTPARDPGQPTAPVTGDAEIDSALAGLSDLSEAPLADHHGRLAEVHEVLHGALDRSDPAVESR